ncbi:hypothetical protein NHQ30_010845 [Ciborinia camelliae]|nr:hypothetical protein NHQ30_010845 [Ciborinia camelliae]
MTCSSANSSTHRGSIKSNIGHLEGASGLAGVIKAILVLEKGIIPPNANFRDINIRANENYLKLTVPRQPMAWPMNGLRRASVNSFGLGGANAHVILDDAFHFLKDFVPRGVQAPKYQCGKCKRGTDPHLSSIIPVSIQPHGSYTIKSSGNGNGASKPAARLLVWSAHDTDALARLLNQNKDHFATLINNGQLDFEDHSEFMESLAHTLCNRRSLLTTRSYAIARNISEVLIELESSIMRTAIMQPSPPKLAFVFTGQGAQWARMGHELLSYPKFHESLREAELYYLEELYAPWRLFDELLKLDAVSNINRPEFSQPLCTAIQVGLIDLLESFKISPTVVVGHSSGEIAAAYCAGAITRRAAWKLAYQRGLQASSLAKLSSQTGGMLAVALSATKTQSFIDQCEKKLEMPGLTIACHNSDSNVTVSGLSGHVDALQLILSAAGIRWHRLKITIAYHSPQMNIIANSYRQAMGDIEKATKHKSRRPIMISSVTGQRVTNDELCRAEYWVQNMVSPVKFSDAMSGLCIPARLDPVAKLDQSHLSSTSVDVIIEVGPHSALRGPIRDILQSSSNKKTTYMTILNRNYDSAETILAAVGQLHCMGYPVDLKCANRLDITQKKKILIDLPCYPFNNTRRYWCESRLSKGFRFGEDASHEILGKPVADWNPLDARWRNFISTSRMPWVEDHKIQNRILYPAGAMLAMAIEAAYILSRKISKAPIEGFNLRDIFFQEALVIPQSTEEVEVQLSLRQLNYKSSGESPGVDSWFGFDLFSCTNNHWTKICYGKIGVESRVSDDKQDDEPRNQPRLITQYHRDIFNEAVSLPHRTYSSENLYSTLERLGYNFGPNFQTLKNVIVCGSQVVADIKIFDGDAKLARNSDHVIHPTTLDGLIHMILPSLQSAGASGAGTLIPTYIQDFWISRSGLGSHCFPADSTFVRATAKQSPGRESKTNVSVLDAAANLVLATINGLEFASIGTSISSSIPPHLNQRYKEVCRHIEWKPDITLMDNTEVHAFCSSDESHPSENIHTVNSAPYKSYRSLRAFLDLLTHQNPNMNIMQIGANIDHGETSQFVLDVIGATIKSDSNYSRKYASFDVTDAFESSSDQEAFIERIEHGHSGVSVKVFDTKKKLEDQGFSTGFYDLLIINVRQELKVEASSSMNESIALKVLFRNGKAILLGMFTSRLVDTDDGIPGVPSSGYTKIWDESLQQCGFDGVDMLFRASKSEDGSSVLVSTAGPPKTSILNNNSQPRMIILHSREWHKEALALQARLLCLGRSIDLADVDEEASMIKNLESAVLIFTLELEKPHLRDMNSREFELLKRLISTAKGVIWLSREGSNVPDPYFRLAEGLFRVVRREKDTIKYVVIGLDSEGFLSDLQREKLCRIISRTEWDFDAVGLQYESEFHEVSGNFEIGRTVASAEISRKVQNSSLSQELKMSRLGDLPPVRMEIAGTDVSNSFIFAPDSSYYLPLAEDEVEVRVDAVGLTYADYIRTTGKSSAEEMRYGNECAGVVARAGVNSGFKPGQLVCGLTTEACKNYVRLKSDCCITVPDKLSLSDAASFPLAFVTAHYALHEVARLRNKDNVLIECAFETTGQAAIQISKLCCAGQIFATVSNSDQKTTLMNIYDIPEKNIFIGKELITLNRVIDVVISSVHGSISGYGYMTNWNYLAPHGRIVDIGQHSTSDHYIKLPSLKGISYSKIDIPGLIAESPNLLKQSLCEVARLFDTQDLRHKHSVKKWPISAVGEAMEYIEVSSLGKDSVKAVLELKPYSVVPTTILGDDHSKGLFSANRTYIISGGLGGLGRHIASWMVDNGAKFLLLLSRSGVVDPATMKFIQDLEAKGVTIKTPACDVCNMDSLKTTLESIQGSCPRIGGCIQAAMVLRVCLTALVNLDSLFESMSYEDWKAAIEPKVTGSWNLHNALPQDMDFFILLSSIVGIAGQIGQSNYSSGNTFQDALARYRVSQGLRAVSIDLGRMTAAGRLAENAELEKKFIASDNFLHLTPNDLTALLGHYCRASTGLLSPTESQVLFGLVTSDSGERSLLEAPLFKYMHNVPSGNERPNKKDDDSPPIANWAALFMEAKNVTDSGAVVTKALIQKFVTALNTTIHIDEQKPILTYGLDSLLAVELRNWLGKEFKATVTVTEIMAGATFVSVGVMVAQRSSMLNC